MKKLFIATLFIGFLFFLKLNSQESLKLNAPYSFQIYRDSEGLAHVNAYNKSSLFFAMGYAQAQDRLWSLLIKKFFVEGRMAQLFGRDALQSDHFSRNFKFFEVGKMNKKGLDQQTKLNAQAYCDGINYYARNSKILPFQFYMFWIEWQDWQIQNSLGLLALTSFTLQFDWMYELARQRLLETVGFDLALKLINYGSSSLFKEITIINDQQLKQTNRYSFYNVSNQRQVLNEHWKRINTTLGKIHLPSFQYQGTGSNSWVIGGNHTKNGKPLLANDPHLGLMIPSIFYPIELVLLNQKDQIQNRVFGASLSGLPAISIGVNEKYAWGSTASYVDNKDVYLQKTKMQNNKFQYLYENEWRDFKQRKQIFKVRWQGQHQMKYYESHRGPVIQEIFDQIYVKYGYPLPNNYRQNHTLTIQAAIYQPDYTSLTGLMNVAFSKNMSYFQNCSNSINSPNIDSTFITNQLEFGYASVGRIPKRKIPQMGSFIKDGSTSTYNMGEFLNWSQKPKLYNPKKGYVGMCNNKFATDHFDLRSSLHQITTGRAYRLHKIITQKINSNYKFEYKDMMEMQLDFKDQFLSQTFPGVLKSLAKIRYIWSNQVTQSYYSLLSSWNYVLEKDSIEATLYQVWERLLQNNFIKNLQLTQQERQSIINHAFFENYQFNLFQKITKGSLGDEQKVICQSQQTLNFTNIHPCEALIAVSMKKLPFQLQKLFGTNDVKQFKWGNIHLATYKSVPFSQIPILKNIWGRQIPEGGNSRTLNVGILTHQIKDNNKYRSVAGPVFRFITDLQKTYYSMDTGISGSLSNPSYDNFLGKNNYVQYKSYNPKKQIPQSWTLVTKTVKYSSTLNQK